LEAGGIRLVAEINLAGILGDNDEGLSIQQIEKQTGVDGEKLGKFCFLALAYVIWHLLVFLMAERVVRMLIGQGWFREPKPGYFANSRLSRIIAKDQPGYHSATCM
jgi:hypothetical protein